MAPRNSTRPARENDFSNVGKIGRRTGVMLPQGQLDVNGMEEISGIFSSPRKPSPLRKSMAVMESIEEANPAETPSRALSGRKSFPPPRSASPRKSGISGTPRRSKAVDILNQNKGKAAVTATATGDQDGAEIQPVMTPSLSDGARTSSANKTPVRDQPLSKSQSAKTRGREQASLHSSIPESVEIPQDPSELYEVVQIPATTTQNEEVTEQYDLPAIGDDEDQVSIGASYEDDVDAPPLPLPFDDEEADQTFEPENRSKLRSREPTVANSRRKRKSDAMEQELEPELEAEAISSPAAKRAKRISDQSTKDSRKAKSSKTVTAESAAPKPKGRPPLKAKDANLKLSARQEDELNNIIEKVKARPGQKKSLYVLRKETPEGDGVTHTRSGRVSVKPLAYWRNEKCVYGGSPGGATLQDGARFPLNSIKEIIRIDDVGQKSTKKSKPSAKGKGKVVPRSQSAPTIESEESDQDSEVDHEDPDAEPWETERGIFKGPVAVWDPEDQTPLDEEEDIDIAYASASIETREVKGSTFRYAKMLSLKFFGSGIVDLPPAGVKKAKNSRRMHMSFFVATGRVTVRVGPLGGPENKFSIGKGGWWQVPRGNQYSIENNLQKPARVFFSQACEPVPLDEEE